MGTAGTSISPDCQTLSRFMGIDNGKWLGDHLGKWNRDFGTSIVKSHLTFRDRWINKNKDKPH